MSDLPEQTPPDEGEEMENGLEVPSGPGKQVIRQMMTQFEMMAMRKGREGIDISIFSNEQKDKLLDIVLQSEQNSSNLQKEKIAADKEISLARIKAKTVVQRTNRYIYLGTLVAVFVISLIVFLKVPDYITQWLSFVTGICGGYGIGYAAKSKSEDVTLKEAQE